MSETALEPNLVSTKAAQLLPGLQSNSRNEQPGHERKKAKTNELSLPSPAYSNLCIIPIIAILTIRVNMHKAEAEEFLDSMRK